MRADERRCPRCAETIKRDALVCRHCRHELTEEERRAAPPKTTARNLIIGIVFVIVVIAVVGNEATQDNAAAPAASLPAVEPLAVNSVELGRAYEANEAAAQRYYGDRPLLVSGKIEGITLDISDDPVVQMEGADRFSRVQLQLAEAGHARAADLKKGDKLTLRCEKVSEVIGTPILRECTFPG